MAGPPRIPKECWQTKQTCANLNTNYLGTLVLFFLCNDRHQPIMRQRITFLHKPEDAIDPKSIKVTDDSLAFSGLKAAREDRITFGLDELPLEIALALKQS